MQPRSKALLTAYRAIDGSEDTFSYGLFIGAGSGSQNMSLWPSLYYNETRLAGNDFCVQGSPSDCNDPKYTHGHFGGDASSTWQETSQYTSLDAVPSDLQVNYTYGQDDLNMFTHFYDPSPASKFIVPNQSLTVMSDYTSQQDVFFHSGSLGLGSASTVLKNLINLGRIDRNVFSMYLGTAYPRAGGTQNGSLVLGGYDAGRIQGTAHKYPLSSVPVSKTTPFKVHVKQMSLVTQDGSSIGLVTDNGFDGYLSTSQYTMDLPQQITKQLSDALAGSPAGGAENALQLAKAFNGNLTITLDDGYEITYPSEWISNISNMTPFSASNLASNASNASAETGPLVFGTAFLHHLYMTVDYDAESFYLADAKVFDNYVQPESLCAGTVPGPAPIPSINKFVQTGLIGALLGGIIGGAGVSWFVYFLLRKRLQAARAEKAISQMEGKSALSTRRRSRVLAHLGISRPKKNVKFDNDGAKRVSISDSDASSVKGVVVSVKDKGIKSPNSNIEMNDMRKTGHQSTTGATMVNPVAPVTPGKVSSDKVKTTVVERNNADTYDAYALETPFTASLFTPRTGNPLLGDFRQNMKFANYDDQDNSDIPKHHSRTPSRDLQKTHPLTINTSPSGTPRHKPAPLPLRVVGETSRNEAPRRHSLLRKMFPAS